MPDSLKPTTTKWMAQSKTILGATLAFLTAVGPTLDIHLTDDDAVLIGQGWDQVLLAVGFGLTIWGRFTAKTSVTLTPRKRPKESNGR